MTNCVFHILLFLTCCFTGYAQELLFTNSSSEFQLPSQECYKILQDRQGYIWFSTDNGLCRYGNGTLKIFDERNGLPEESVYNMSEDPNGRLWFLTSANRVLYFEHGKLKEASFSAQYQKPGTGNWTHPTPLLLDMSDPENAYIANLYYCFRIKRSTNQAFMIPRTNPEVSIQFLKKQGHPFIPVQLMKTDASFLTFILDNGKKLRKVTFSDLSLKNAIHWNMPTAFSGNTDFIGIHNKLVKVKADLSYSVTNFPARILSIYTDRSNGLWVGIQNNGVYYFPDIRTMKQAHHSLAAFSVTGICEDREHGIWCTTLEKGIFYSPNKYLLSYTALPGLNKRMTLLKYTSGSLFASSSSLAVYQWTKQASEVHTFQFGETLFSDILHEENQWLLTGKEIMIRTDNHLVFKEKLMQVPRYNVACIELAMGKNRQVYGILGKNFMGVNATKLVTLLTYNFRCITKTMVYRSGDLVLLGSDQGLYELNVVTFALRKINGIPGNIRRIIKTRSGRVWIATKNDGIYWLDGDTPINATQQLKLKTLLFHDLTEDPNGTVWAGSNQGLYHFSPQGGRYQTALYTTSHGLPSNEVYKVAADAEHIWFSTYEGLFNLPVARSFFNNVGPPIHLQKLSVKNKAVKARPHVFRFPHNQNDLHFTFDILTFKYGPDTKLEYHLDNGEETIRTRAKGNEVFLENLDPGTYRLAVYGINNDGIRSPHPEKFLITIEAPFWQTAWFILLLVLAVIVSVFLVVRLIVRSIRRGEEAKTLVNKLMAEYQITALQAQMNPHFIFNAINTIQGYILEKNEDEAYHYLAKFGRLIRTVLHHSQEKVLLLENELEVLNLYIELEQLRFDNCFDYRIELDKDIDPADVYLPGMLLQPYVENAIWHGLVNLRNSRRGQLEVNMQLSGNLLVVTITDNGIGRELAMSFSKDRRHKSVGMQLTGERLHIINQLHGYETASVTITDLFDQPGQPAGTRVEVRIPINT